MVVGGGKARFLTSTTDGFQSLSEIDVPAEISLAAAVLLLGLASTRTTPVSGAPRLPYCMMGSCFDCLMEVDGIPNQRACQVRVRAGMRVRIQAGAAELSGGV